MVYSTDSKLNERIRQDQKSDGRPPAGPSLAPEKQNVGIRREKKGRGGKTVTLVHDIQLTPADLKALGKKLKAACGTGGTAKDGVIIIQGDHRETIQEALQKLGYKSRFTGG
jgi:translation initiation factor 1